MEGENVFKKIGLPYKEVPAELKQKVMADIETAKLLLEMTSLFSSGYNLAITELFKKNNEQ
jgi:hypothetical protein